MLLHQKYNYPKVKEIIPQRQQWEKFISNKSSSGNINDLNTNLHKQKKVDAEFRPIVLDLEDYLRAVDEAGFQD